MVATTPYAYTADPLADLDPALHAIDGDLWEALLEAEYTDAGAVDPAGVFGLLRGLRAMGCALEFGDGAALRLYPPDGVDRDALVGWIGSDADAVRCALSRRAPEVLHAAA